MCVCKKNIIIMHIKEKQATGKKFDLVSCLRFSFEERTLNHRRRQVLTQGLIQNMCNTALSNVYHCVSFVEST